MTTPMKIIPAIFEEREIRRLYDEKTETWFFSVVDIVQVLTQQPDYQTARKYWNKLKERLSKEGSQSVTNCHRLKLLAADGKSYLTDVANAETLLRLVQSVPSPKAEPIKRWLAKVGYERMQEMSDPARALERARATWQKHGRSDKWIQQRMTGQETRNKLTDYWATHDIKKDDEYAILTNIIHQEWSDLSVKAHKDLKGLKTQNLRDHMSEAELIFTALAELSTRQIAETIAATGVDARNIRNIVLMRPINSMIEFKQIIGRGTRLYEGKDYFTIYDFVKAHHHFNDPEWDGEPIEPEEPQLCPKCGRRPCECERSPTEPCPVCGMLKCVCKKRKKAKVKLADGKERTIQHMIATTFWHPDGTPMSTQQFLELLFGKLPEFFKNEDELRALWSAPDTRAKLLQGLAEKGFGHDQLAEMQKIIDAEKSDLFDVLAYVAYAMPPLTSEERAANAKIVISTHFNGKQQVFLDFVLSHYVSIGVEELDQQKLTPLLRLKYHDSIADAVTDLGKPDEIGKVFAGFQKYLYQDVA